MDINTPLTDERFELQQPDGPNGTSSAPEDGNGSRRRARASAKKEARKSDSKTGLGERETPSSPYVSERFAHRHP